MLHYHYRDQYDRDESWMAGALLLGVAVVFTVGVGVLLAIPMRWLLRWRSRR